MNEHRKSAAASKAAKLTALALKRVIPKLRTGPPNNDVMTSDEPTGIPPTADKPAFKNGGRIYGSLKALRSDRPVSKDRRAMGGAVDDESKGEEMSKKAAASATLTGQSNRIGYAEGGAVNAKKGKKSGTTINIVIAGSGGPSGPPAMPVGGPPMPPSGIPMPRPMGAGPPPGTGPIMPGGMPPGAPGPTPPGGVLPLRAAGGRVGGTVTTGYDAGSGGALGRLEKKRKYGSNADTKTAGNN